MASLFPSLPAPSRVLLALPPLALVSPNSVMMDKTRGQSGPSGRRLLKTQARAVTRWEMNSVGGDRVVSERRLGTKFLQECPQRVLISSGCWTLTGGDVDVRTACQSRPAVAVQ